MLDYKKLSKEVSKTIRSFTADELQEWLDMDRKRMALVDIENGSSQTLPKPRMAVGKLNGSPANASKKSAPAKPRVTNVKAKKAKVYA